jgi:hypothetical protein
MVSSPACDRIRSKCVFAPLLAKISEDQKAGRPGSLGPVKAFRGVQFFDQFSPSRYSLRGSIDRCVLRNFTDLIVHGDVHGDFMAFLAVLFEAGFIDAKADYVPPESERVRRCVVALGDVLDRGGRGDVGRDSLQWANEELAIIEYAHTLNLVASEHKERVLLLSGNHELRALNGGDDYTTTATAMPYNIPRKELFSRPQAVAYFALERPVMAVSDDGWLLAHGDFQEKPMRAFVRGNPRMLGALQASGDLRLFEALCVAVNATWSAWLLAEKAESPEIRDRLVQFADLVSYRRSLKAGKLPQLPMTVLHGRTLANLGKLDCGLKTPACTRSVGAIQKLLGLDWTTRGGIALGHTVQSHLSDACGKSVYLNDVGMSEAFYGVNGSPVAFLRIDRREQVTQIEVAAKTGTRTVIHAKQRQEWQ